MSIAFTKIRTTVRTIIGLQALRIGFALGRMIHPESTLQRAARLFCTPFASSRSRALAAPTHGARESTLDVDGLAIHLARKRM